MDWTTQSMRRTLVACLLVLSACGSDSGADAIVNTTVPTDAPVPEASEEESEEEPEEEAMNDDQPAELFPDVVDVRASQSSDRTWKFDVTLSSPYDSPDRYADAWRVRSVQSGDGGPVEYGIRVLGHDHASEQPFTRSQSGIEIPAEVTEVLIEGRDQVSGWGGATMVFSLPS